jgi:hypothetical protein
MTVLALPVKPFRAWQYRKGEAVPEWVGQSPLYDQRWYVELSEWVTWYSPAEFSERFKVIDQNAAEKA